MSCQKVRRSQLYLISLYLGINYNINIFSIDYECTQEDVQVIEYMKRKHMDDLLVQIDDAWVNRDDMNCLSMIMNMSMVV